MNNTIIDTHCHLADPKLLPNVGDIIAEARETGVGNIIVPSTSLADAEIVLDLVNKYPRYLKALVGIHPENLNSQSQLENDLDKLSKLATLPGVVGIGEIGLDFHYDPNRETLKLQTSYFKAQLDLACKLDLPVAIHMREAEAETLEVLSNLEKIPKGQFHCFSGSSSFLTKVLEYGFYISYCGNITYKSANSLRSSCLSAPLERLLLETDSPYLAPEGKRGQVNTPANVKIIANEIARLRNLEVEKLIEITCQNTQRLFNLELLTNQNDKTNQEIHP